MIIKVQMKCLKMYKKKSKIKYSNKSEESFNLKILLPKMFQMILILHLSKNIFYLIICVKIDGINDKLIIKFCKRK